MDLISSFSLIVPFLLDSQCHFIIAEIVVMMKFNVLKKVDFHLARPFSAFCPTGDVMWCNVMWCEVPHNRVNGGKLSRYHFFITTNLSHGISTIKMYIWTSVGAYNLVFIVIFSNLQFLSFFVPNLIGWHQELTFFYSSLTLCLLTYPLAKL